MESFADYYAKYLNLIKYFTSDIDSNYKEDLFQELSLILYTTYTSILEKRLIVLDEDGYFFKIFRNYKIQFLIKLSKIKRQVDFLLMKL